MLSDRLARAALEPRRREEILTRARGIIRRHLAPVQAWIRRHGEILDVIPPVAGAIILVKYRLPVGSVALFDRLRLEKSVLVTPGAHFGIGKYLRIGYGYDLEKTLLGLAEVSDFLESFQTAMRAPARAAGGRQTQA